MFGALSYMARFPEYSRGCGERDYDNDKMQYSVTQSVGHGVHAESLNTQSIWDHSAATAY